MAGCGDRSAGEWTIVFPAARDGDWAIYVVDQEGGAPVRIAPLHDPIFGEPPVPSPDGRKLILPSPRYQLVVMDTDGTGRKRLASGNPSSAVWSPDGKRIVFPGLSEGLSIIGADGKGGRV
jgi:Tol biopolymer transport system component